MEAEGAERTTGHVHDGSHSDVYDGNASDEVGDDGILKGGLPERRGEERSRAMELAEHSRAAVELHQQRQLDVEAAVEAAMAAEQRRRREYGASVSMPNEGGSGMHAREPKSRAQFLDASTSGSGAHRSLWGSSSERRRRASMTDARPIRRQTIAVIPTSLTASSAAALMAVPDSGIGGWDDATPESTPSKTMSLMRSAATAALANQSVGSFTAIADGNGDIFTKLIAVFEALRTEAKELREAVDIQSLLRRVDEAFKGRQHILDAPARVCMRTGTEHSFTYVLHTELSSLQSNGIDEITIQQFMAFFGLGGGFEAEAQRRHLDGSSGICDTSDGTSLSAAQHVHTMAMLGEDEPRVLKSAGGSRGYVPPHPSKSMNTSKQGKAFDELLSQLRMEGGAGQKVLVTGGCGVSARENPNVKLRSAAHIRSCVAPASNFQSGINALEANQDAMYDLMMSNDAKILDLGTLHWTDVSTSKESVTPAVMPSAPDINMDTPPPRLHHTLTAVHRPRKALFDDGSCETSACPMHVHNGQANLAVPSLLRHMWRGVRAVDTDHGTPRARMLTAQLCAFLQSMVDDEDDSNKILSRNLVEDILAELFPPTLVERGVGHVAQRLLDRCVRLDASLSIANTGTSNDDPHDGIRADTLCSVLRNDKFVFANLADGVRRASRRAERPHVVDDESRAIGVSVDGVVLKQRELLRSINSLVGGHQSVTVDAVFVRVQVDVLTTRGTTDDLESVFHWASDSTDHESGIVRLDRASKEDIVLDAEGEQALPLSSLEFTTSIHRSATTMTAEAGTAAAGRSGTSATTFTQQQKRPATAVTKSSFADAMAGALEACGQDSTPASTTTTATLSIAIYANATLRDDNDIAETKEELLLGRHDIDIRTLRGADTRGNASLTSPRGLCAGAARVCIRSHRFMENVANENRVHEATVDSFDAYAISDGSISTLDARTCSWSTVAPSDLAKRRKHSAVVFNNLVLVYGGRDESTVPRRIRNDVACFDTFTCTWSALEPFIKMKVQTTPSQHQQHATTKRRANSTATSSSGGGSASSTTNGSSLQSSSAFLGPEAREAHAAVLLRTRQFTWMLVTGGLTTASGVFASMPTAAVAAQKTGASISSMDVLILCLSAADDFVVECGSSGDGKAEMEASNIFWFRPRITGDEFPKPRAGHAAACVAPHVAVGGADADGTGESGENKNNEGHTYQSPSAHDPRSIEVATASDTTKSLPSVYIFGGRTSDGELTNELVRLDVLSVGSPASASSVTASVVKVTSPTSPSPRQYASMQAVCGKQRLVVIGGCVALDLTYGEPWSQDVWIFTLQTRAWCRVDFTADPNAVGCRYGLASAAVDLGGISTTRCTVHTIVAAPTEVQARHRCARAIAVEDEPLQYTAGECVQLAVAVRDVHGIVVDAGASESFSVEVRRSGGGGNDRSAAEAAPSPGPTYCGFNTKRTLLGTARVAGLKGGGVYVEKIMTRLYGAGEYTMSITDRHGKHVTGSPIRLAVSHARLSLDTSFTEQVFTTTEEGDAIPCSAGEDVQFVVTLRDLFGNPVRAENADILARIDALDLPDRPPLELDDVPAFARAAKEAGRDGALMVSCKVRTSGRHVLRLRPQTESSTTHGTLDFLFDVKSGAVDGTSCTVSGRCIEDAWLVGETAFVKIHSRDKHGNRVLNDPGEGLFVGYFCRRHENGTKDGGGGGISSAGKKDPKAAPETAPAPSTVAHDMVTVTKTMTEGAVRNIGSGVHHFSFTPIKAGCYDVKLYRVGADTQMHELACSPVHINATRTAMHSPSCVALAPGLHGAFTAGESTTITVIAKDRFGEKLRRGGDRVRVRLLNLKMNASASASKLGTTTLLPKDNYTSSIGRMFEGEDRGDGTYEVTVTPTVAGKVHVLVETKPEAEVISPKGTHSGRRPGNAKTVLLPLHNGYLPCALLAARSSQESLDLAKEPLNAIETQLSSGTLAAGTSPDTDIGICRDVICIECVAGAVHASSCTATGAGISGKGMARSTNSFSIVARDAFGNRVGVGGSSLSVDISGGWGAIVDWKGKWKDNGDGTYDVWYHPSSVPALRGSTLYEICVRLNGNEIMHSPFYQAVQPLQPYAAACECIGLRRGTSTLLTSGTSIDVTIVTRDRNGTECAFSVGDGLDVSCSDAGDARLGIDVRDMQDGSYRVRLSCAAEEHRSVRLIVRLYGQHIRGSPFELSCVPAGQFNIGLWSGYRIQDESIVEMLSLDGDGIARCVCGEAASFDIISAGEAGEMLPPEAFHVELVSVADGTRVTGSVMRAAPRRNPIAPPPPPPVFPSDPNGVSGESDDEHEGEQRCQATYTIEKAGEYTLSVRVSTHLVGGYSLLVVADPGELCPQSSTVHVTTTPAAAQTAESDRHYPSMDSAISAAQAISAYRNEPMRIHIVPRDAYGNVVSLGGYGDRSFAVAVRGGGERIGGRAKFISATRLHIEELNFPEMDTSTAACFSPSTVCYTATFLPPYTGVYAVDILYNTAAPIVPRGAYAMAPVRSDGSALVHADERPVGGSPFEIRCARRGTPSTTSIHEVRRLGKIAFIKSITETAAALAVKPIASNQSDRALVTASLFKPEKVSGPAPIVSPEHEAEILGRVRGRVATRLYTSSDAAADTDPAAVIEVLMAMRGSARSVPNLTSADRMHASPGSLPHFRHPGGGNLNDSNGAGDGKSSLGISKRQEQSKQKRSHPQSRLRSKSQQLEPIQQKQSSSSTSTSSSLSSAQNKQHQKQQQKVNRDRGTYGGASALRRK